MSNDLEKLYQKRLQERNNVFSNKKNNIINSNDRSINDVNDKINKLKQENYQKNTLNNLYQKKIKERRLKNYNNEKKNN